MGLTQFTQSHFKSIFSLSLDELLDCTNVDKPLAT